MPANTEARRARRRQAILSAAIKGALFLITAAALFAMSRICTGDMLPVILRILAAIDLLSLLPLALSLRERLHEIEGGEEDAARNY